MLWAAGTLQNVCCKKVIVVKLLALLLMNCAVWLSFLKKRTSFLPDVEKAETVTHLAIVSSCYQLAVAQVPG